MFLVVYSFLNIALLWPSASFYRPSNQRSTEGRISTAVAEGFAPSATATEGSYDRRPKFLSTIVKTFEIYFHIKKQFLETFSLILKIFKP